MCGIFFSLSNKHYVAPSARELHSLKRRGPDSCCTVQRKFQYGLGEALCYLTIYATVLSLRGNHLVEQPIEDPNSSSLFCWNGEAWTIDGENVGGNDAQTVFDLLLKATQPSIDWEPEPPVEGALSRKAVKALGSISGPFAFLYYDATNQQLFFGRDVLGRRSLLKMIGEDGCLYISSVSEESHLASWTEIEADGLYTIDIARMLKVLHSPIDEVPNSSKAAWGIKLIPWSLRSSASYSTPYLVRALLQI